MNIDHVDSLYREASDLAESLLLSFQVTARAVYRVSSGCGIHCHTFVLGAHGRRHSGGSWVLWCLRFSGFFCYFEAFPRKRSHSGRTLEVLWMAR